MELTGEFRMATGNEIGSDPIVAEIREMLGRYRMVHPEAIADAYRYNNASVRIKIQDPRFAGMSKGDRHDDVWDNYVSRLSDETQSDVSMLLLVAPGELSFLGEEFADPSPTRL